MEAIRETVHVTSSILHLHLPDEFNDRDVEVIVLPTELPDISGTEQRRRPAPRLAATKIVGDIEQPVVSEEEWDALHESDS